MRRLRRPLLLCLLGLLAAPAAGEAAPRASFGTDISRPLFEDARTIERELDQTRALGLRIARLEVTWGKVEPQPGQLDAAELAKLDATAAAARRRGIKLFVHFLSTPCWASSAPPGADCSRYPPRDPRDAVLAATTVARRLAADSAAFEVWNEPDHRNELYWAGPDKVQRYVALAKTLYAPLKQAAPRVPVLAGAFVGTNGAWLKALYAAGIKGSYDAMSVHFYDLTLAALRETRRVMAQHGDRTPVWLGETGWSSCGPNRTQLGHRCTDRAAQASQTADLVRAMRRTPWVRGVVFFTLRDDASFDFGLFDRRRRAKPVARALRSELRTRRPRAARRLAVRLRRSRGRLVITGRGPGADVYRVEATTSRLLFRGFARLDGRGRLAFALPRQLGTSGVRVRVKHLWTGRSASLRR